MLPAGHGVGTARRSLDWLAGVGIGKARPGLKRSGSECLGTERPGEDGLGEALRGQARRGKQWARRGVGEVGLALDVRMRGETREWSDEWRQQLK